MQVIATRLFVTLVLVGLLFPSSVLAHRVNIFAYIDGGMVYVESYFPDGSPVVAGKIQVRDSAGKLLLKAVTDSEGLFDFPVPKRDDLTLFLDAGMGHRNSFLLKKTTMDE